MTWSVRSTRFDVVWLLVVAVASSLWCLSAANAVGPAFDEPFYVEAGLAHWRTGSSADLIQRGAMPLAPDVAALPAYLREVATGVPADPLTDMPALLRSARWASLLFWIVLLAYVHIAARRLGGVWAGRLAVTLIASEPLLLGHAALANADIAITACLVALAFHFAEGRERGWWPRIGIPGVWYGAALLSKASTVVFGPACLVGVEVARRLSGRDARPFFKEFMAIASIGVALMFVYCGSDWRAESSFVEWAHTLPPGRMSDVWLWIATHLRIFPNGAEGLVRQVKHGIRGHGGGAFLLGQVSSSFWYYFPAALSIKTSLPLLVMPLVVSASRVAALRNWPNVIAVGLVALSLTSRVQIGVRYYLPVIAFAAIGLSVSLVHAYQTRRRVVGAVVAGATAVGVASSMAAATAVWPHGICYVNPLWGGSTRSLELLSDSNCDWGQGLPDLLEWAEGHKDAPIALWYFGTDSRWLSSPFEPLPLHAWPLTTDQQILERVKGRYVAVSGTLLYGTRLSAAHALAADFLRTQQPIARTMTFVIFDFTDRRPMP